MECLAVRGNKLESDMPRTKGIPSTFCVPRVRGTTEKGDMSFSACVSLGDHQLENQPSWGEEFATAEEARVMADYLYEWAMAYYLPRQSGPLNWQEINAYAWRNVDGHGYCLDDDDQVFYWRGCPSAKIEKMLE